MADNNTEKQRVQELTNKLEQGLQDLFNSDSYRNYLSTMSKFHNYSFNNTLLIAMQKPDATLVAGYKAWQKNFERHVNKGEKAIRILAPAPYKIKEERDKIDPVTQELLLDKDGNPQKEEVEITIPAFRAVSVFDLSQTDGKPIPELTAKELLSDVEGYQDMIRAVEAISPVPIELEEIAGDSKGYYDREAKRIAEIKYSDVLQFYYYLLNEVKISLGTLDTVHCLLHPTFQLAVRDEIIRNNPTDGVMKEISRESGKNRGIRHALTVEQQRAFMEYIANHPIYYHWWPMFTVLLGTGCRIGEALGLRWQDLDYDRRTISINHSLSYYQKPENNKSVLRISKPKTEAGIRTIPMLDVVKDAFEMLYEEQLENGFNETEIDGMSGFIFCNRFGTVPNPQTVNHTIKRIANSYNADEVVRAKKERRDPIILPNFSCHHLRHTFCTRLCENETNLKVIQSIMGHRNIETTMDIYAEATEEKKQESFENLATKLDVF